MRISDWSSDVCSSDLAQGLAYDVQSMDATFARLYPEQYAATISGDRMAQDARERWKNTLDGLHTAMRMQAQVSQNLAQDESALADLVSKSQSATGASQAQQAPNQLLALQAPQSNQPHQRYTYLRMGKTCDRPGKS